jgi:ADP-heptose:LPS heptosyltransferase
VSFFATGWHAEVLRLFCMPISDDPTDAVYTDEGYEKAVAQKSPMNYLQWIAYHLGVKETPIRPMLIMDPMSREMGRKASGEVLIFPHGVWSPRCWPKSYFVELADLLKRDGYSVRIVTKERDYAFFMPFHCIVGKSFAFIAAAIQSAKLVIGNDSGPAHLAGTIGTPTIAIHGPTQGKRIYGHIPEVMPFEKKSLPCHGCHCLPPWRASCEIGCHQLYRTFPEEVYDAAIKVLGAPESPAVPGVLRRAA